MVKKADDRVPSERELLADRSNLTHGQLAVWTAQRRAAAVARFNRVVLYDLEGRLDTAAFQRAFRALVDSNDALRTVVLEQDGAPQRQLLASIEGGLSQLDFSAEQDPDATLQGWLAERCSGVVFEDGQPLFHSALIRLRSSVYVWYLNQHQLITDIASTALLCRRMADLYGLAVRGELDRDIHYPDYAEYVTFERRHRETGVYKHSRNYWSSKLAEPVPRLDFFGRLHEQHGGSYTLSCSLGIERSERLRELARTPGHFLHSLALSRYLGFVTLLFAFVYRASGSQQLRIGAPFTSRSTQQFDDTVGLFSEVCPLQIEVDPADSLNGLLQRLRKEIKTVLMQAQPGVSCTVADHPCQVMFDYVSIDCIRFRGLSSQLRWLNSGCGGSGSSLRLQVLDYVGCDGTVLQFEMDAGSFDAEQARQIPDRFVALVDAFLGDRDRMLADIPWPAVEPAVELLHDIDEIPSDSIAEPI